MVVLLPGSLILVLPMSLPITCNGADSASSETATNRDLLDMPLDKLMNIRVSILGAPETVSKTPAAVSVVTQDDIRRLGAMNIPEALRYVPGLDVAQVDGSQWAVSARGFNDVFANKLLVLQDGRSIYTPLFSGVFWDVQGTLMEDIDRIEVVRGPGATLWGANAVNGVINIITKSAEETQGALISGGGGNQDLGFAGGRYGGKIGDNAYYRIYGSYMNHDSSVMPDGSDAHNSWQMARGGFRSDWNVSDQNLVTFQGDVYGGWIHQVFSLFDPLNPPTYSQTDFDTMEARGGNVLGRWTHDFSESSNLKLQMYYDRTERDAAILSERRDTFDLNLQHAFGLGEYNAITLGAGYRFTGDRENDRPGVSFNPGYDALNLFSAFAQDDVKLVPDKLNLTLGSKFEHNDYTGLEIQPGARLLWTPMHRQTVWASVSRAVRTPSRAEEAIALTQSRQVVPGVYAPITILGTNSFQSEDLIAYELGYRTEPVKRLTLDLVAFYNDYNHLRSQEPMSPGTPTEFYVANKLSGHTYGLEATATWQVNDWWRLRPTYSLLKMDFHASRDRFGYADTTSVRQAEGSSPDNQFSLWSSMDLPRHIAFDTELRYVDDLSYFHIGSYFELNARIGWHITPNLELSIVGQNLLHDQHAEFGPTYITTQNGNVTEIPRSVYAKVTWHF